MALIDTNAGIAVRNLTAYSAKALREMTGKALKALAEKNGIQVGKTSQETLDYIMSARLSESRRLGHISRNVVTQANKNSVAPEGLPLDIWAKYQSEKAAKASKKAPADDSQE
jgi:hypothetical protein